MNLKPLKTKQNNMKQQKCQIKLIKKKNAMK